MVAFSKLFEKSLRHVDCSAVLHPAPGLSCFRSLLWNLYCNHVSCAKYYLPILLLPLIVKYRQLDCELFIKTFNKYAQTVCSGACVTATIFFFTCLARRISGRFIWYWTPAVPTWLSAQLSCALMPKHVINFFLTGISHSTLDSILRYFDNAVTRKLRNSTFCQTLVFMLSSAIILQAKYNFHFDGFWFINAVNNKSGNTSDVQALKGDIRRYLFIGLALDVFNAFSKGPSTGSFIQTCLIKLYNLRFKSTAFLLSYLIMYRVLNFVLTNYTSKFPAKCINLTAAFISGSAYSLLNEIAFMTFGAIISIQVLWNQFCSTKSENYMVNKLKHLEFSKLLYPVEAAFLVHNYFHNPHAINGLTKSFVNGTSANNSQRILNDFVHKLDEEALLKVFKPH